MSKTTRKLNVIVVVVAGLVILASVFITLVVNGVIFSRSGGDSQQGYQNVTYNDAAIECREASENRYGDKIRNLVVDAHSSRFDKGQYLYKIFLNMDLYSKNKRDASLHYISCFVRASNGKIVKFDISAEESKGGRTVNPLDDTNMFGMPKPKNR